MRRLWFMRIAMFFGILILLLLIKNELHIADEYYYAISLDQGEKSLHFHHILSPAAAYLTWFFTTILGFKISAFRALQVTSSIMSAIGAVALVDLGRFWGLRFRRALFFALPMILANGFMRYGVSAYPDSFAIGMGMVALNLLVRATHKNNLRSSYISGLVTGIAGLLHIVFLSLVPGFFIATALNLRKQPLKRKVIFLGLYSLGVLTVIIAAYKILLMVSGLDSRMVEGAGDYFKFGNKNVFSLRWFIQDIKTFIAVFVPGIHHPVRMLDMLFNIPRFLAAGAICLLFYKSWKARKDNRLISTWVMPLLLSVLTLFVMMLSFGYAQCRQYAAIGLVAFGPLFLAMGISAGRFKITNFLMGFISLVFALHMVFGIEGLYDIATRDSKPFREIHDACDVHRPKRVQFPWDEHSNNPDCRWHTEFGPFGPPPGFLSKGKTK